MDSGSSSARLPYRDRTSSQGTRSNDDYLTENFLDEEGDNYVRYNRNESAITTPASSVQPALPSYTPGIQESTSSRMVIAIDYGTTFTGCAYAHPSSDFTALQSEIRVVNNWGPRMTNQPKVPSVISYSPAPLEEVEIGGKVERFRAEQWGSDISRNAVTMHLIKLELDVQDKIDELEMTLQVLNGTGNLSFENVRRSAGLPEYTWKNPEQIVQDYLEKIYDVFNQKHFEDAIRSRISVDLVITVPVKWSYRAKNSTLKAIQKAGYNKTNFPNLDEIMMITEPEAAALFTARYLKEDPSEEFLKIKECFVLCDAGGGTVDVVAYQVTQLEPNLEIDKISMATSGKCGASYINENFKRWLYKIITERHYRALDPRSAEQRIGSHTVETSELRALMKKFEPIKHRFSNGNARTEYIDLPKPLDRLNIPGRVREGSLTVTPDDMREMFDPCVDQVVELIQEQIFQVDRKHAKVRSVFLVGGFGESPYLREELTKSLRLRKIKLRQPKKDQSWTAVVQGAVIYGIEKANHKDARTITTAPRSYGIVVNEAYSGHSYDHRDRYVDRLTRSTMVRKQFAWMVRRGDLVISGEEDQEIEKELTLTFQTSDSWKFSLKVYEYPDADGEEPTRWETEQGDVNEAGVVKCDLTACPKESFDQHRNWDTGETYYIARLVCQMQMSTNHLDVRVYFNKTRVGWARIDLNRNTTVGY